jgi:hypothetical protein
MTPHMKTATIVAPFLLIGGYIAADYFQSEKEKESLTTQAKNIVAMELKQISECDLTSDTCEFEQGDLTMVMSSDNNSYHLDANQALKGVTLGLAQSDRETRSMQMYQIDAPTHWAIPIRRLTNLKKDKPLQMRLAVESKGKRYYVEFSIDPNGPWGSD